MNSNFNSKQQNGKPELRQIRSLTIIFEPTILEHLNEETKSTIKKIMTVVESQPLDDDSYTFIRKVVLDSINDLNRNFAITLEKVCEKIKK